MATFFIIFIILSTFHFIYESIILPSIRLELRYKLFKLRDELIRIKCDERYKVSNEEFQLLESSICSIINRLPFLNISTRFDSMRAYKENIALQKRVKKRINILETCKEEKIKDINNRLIDLVSIAFVFNMGGWIYIVLPLFFVVILSQSFVKIKKYALKSFYGLAYASDKEFNQFVKPALACEQYN